MFCRCSDILGQVKFPRQTAKHLLCLIFLSLAWSETGAPLLCRLASLQEMTHGHLSFIMCELVAGLVVTAKRISWLVLSSWKTYSAPAPRQSGCRAAMFYLFFNCSLFNRIFLCICQNLFQCLQDLWFLEGTNYSCFPFRRRSDLWHFILSSDSKVLQSWVEGRGGKNLNIQFMFPVVFFAYTWLLW